MKGPPGHDASSASTVARQAPRARGGQCGPRRRCFQKAAGRRRRHRSQAVERREDSPGKPEGKPSQDAAGDFCGAQEEAQRHTPGARGGEGEVSVGRMVTHPDPSQPHSSRPGRTQMRRTKTRSTRWAASPRGHREAPGQGRWRPWSWEGSPEVLAGDIRLWVADPALGEGGFRVWGLHCALSPIPSLPGVGGSGACLLSFASAQCSPAGLWVSVLSPGPPDPPRPPGPWAPRDSRRLLTSRSACGRCPALLSPV